MTSRATATAPSRQHPHADSYAGPYPSSTARPTSAAGRPPYRLVAALGDLSGDQGAEGPACGDLRTVTIEDDGTNARVSVTVGSALPSRPASRESLGIGVDLYTSAAQTESTYQLFADGGPDGWFGYLHDPRGYVRYPGTFAVGGSQIVFTVPWKSLGALRSGYFSAFADWTQGGRAGTLGGNAASRDDAPAVGSQGWSR